MSFVMAGIALASAVAGGVMSADGARKAKHAQQDAAKANQANVDQTNEINYAKWLQTQGVGQDGQPINTWLPRYAMAQTTTAPGMDPTTRFAVNPNVDTRIPGSGNRPLAAGTVANDRGWAGLGMMNGGNIPLPAQSSTPMGSFGGNMGVQY